MIDRSRDVENPDSKLLLKGLVISPPRKKECEKRKDGSDHFLCRPIWCLAVSVFSPT